MAELNVVAGDEWVVERDSISLDECVNDREDELRSSSSANSQRFTLAKVEHNFWRSKIEKRKRIFSMIFVCSKYQSMFHYREEEERDLWTFDVQYLNQIHHEDIDTPIRYNFVEFDEVFHLSSRRWSMMTMTMKLLTKSMMSNHWLLIMIDLNSIDLIDDRSTVEFHWKLIRMLGQTRQKREESPWEVKIPYVHVHRIVCRMVIDMSPMLNQEIKHENYCKHEIHRREEDISHRTAHPLKDDAEKNKCSKLLWNRENLSRALPVVRSTKVSLSAL